MTTTKPPVDDEVTQLGPATDTTEGDEDGDDFDWGFAEEKQPLTAKALLESGLVGLWKDRTDIGDTLAFARELRRPVAGTRRCAFSTRT